MSEMNADESEGEAMPEIERRNVKLRRGCMFCMTGQENRVASLIQRDWPAAKAYSVSAAKRRSTKGVKRVDIEVIMPSYVFFEVEEGFRPMPPFPDGAIRILKTAEDDWELKGQDDEFAKWLLAHEGVLNLSLAHKVGDEIVIHQGPLKDFAGCILKIDRRNENGLVQLEVGGNQIRTWLPFEIIDTDIE